REELYAKSGKLLKRMDLENIVKIDGRWYPTKMIFKDMLKSGQGTEFIIVDIKFNQDIPDVKFSKAGLRR
ncbi:MAG: outer membrane lipoprotein-sorting protein, partial [Candidatus Marinimicrobia bacterium]|nr:outer membrane lipoprotein-sorting protein [Candidatus Neomarinimicrobiota bacterium]